MFNNPRAIREWHVTRRRSRHTERTEGLVPEHDRLPGNILDVRLNRVREDQAVCRNQTITSYMQLT